MSRGDCHAILGGSDATARHIVRRDDPADIIRDEMGTSETTLSRWRTALRRLVHIA